MSGAWEGRRVALRVDAPLHLGWRRLGFIERTRYYVPARTVWGALVAGLAAKLHAGEGVPGMYEAAQKDCKEGLRFTCLFPAASPDASGTQVWRPRFVPGRGLLYGEMTGAQFERRLVWSRGSTAIRAENQAAEEGSLHDAEYLAPHWSESEVLGDLYLTGYVFFRGERVTEDALRYVLDGIAFGGERRYGWGRCSCASISAVPNGCVFGEFEVSNGEEEDLLLAARPGDYTLAGHLACADDQTGFHGDVEAVGGRDWSDGRTGGPNHGAGRKVASSKLCWAPGTRGGDGAPREFRVDELGFWSSGLK